MERISKEPVLACDLEADSLHHYQEKVCLIQLSSPHESVLIDPIAFSDLSAFASIMADPSIRKVFHGADYDVRSLHRDFGIEVKNLFDTMVACQFLGEKELGLAAVLKKRFGVELDKRYQKADWSRRPLPPEMIAYAVEDTSLLIPLQNQLAKELREMGRLVWVEEECLLLSNVRSTPRNDSHFFLRFKGAAAMEPRALAILEELLQLRDEKARRRDLPPFKILGNETIRELTVKRPRNPAELTAITGMTAKIIERYGYEIIEAVAKGSSLRAGELPSYPRQPRRQKDKKQEEQLQRLKQWRETKARDLGMDGGILANNALLEALAEKNADRNGDEPNLPPMKRWQRSLFGDELMELLRSI